MYRFRFFITLLGVLCMFLSCKGHTFDFSKSKVLIASNGDRLSVEVADYFYRHLDKRNLNKTQLQVIRSDENTELTGNKVYFEIVPDLQYDYEIINKEGVLSIYAKDKAVFVWLSYMLLNRFAEDHKIEIADIPPSYIDFNTSQVNFAFAYRDPHLLPNMDQDLSGILLTNNVDRDWGIWGHNMKRVLGDSPSLYVYALVDGKRDKDQYCFSSNSTFEAIRSYIIDQHGYEDRSPMWFMIAPNDNDKVCTCSSCTKEGNTAKNATPAVTSLMNKLGKVFEQDHFYTIGYRTTKVAPSKELEKNVGVLFSTIDLPKAAVVNLKDPEVIAFAAEVEKWKTKTSEIFLWDYISNFDEYLVPYPVLQKSKEWLPYFKSIGVKGLFLNGSGYDYVPFDDVKTYVLSALLINPNLSVADLVSKYHQRYYPITGELLSSYFLAMEDEMKQQNLGMSMYSSFREASKSYFDSNRFDMFYDELLKLESKTSGEEKTKINKLIDALSYVKLQISYNNGTVGNGFFLKEKDTYQVSSVNDIFIRRLKKAMDNGVSRYKEDKGDIRVYLGEWENLKKQRIPINLFKNVQVTGLSSSSLFEESYLLNDNKIGFKSDFHQGWFLSGENIKVKGNLASKSINNINLMMTFLINERHRMLAPSKVVVMNGEKILAQFSGVDFINKGNVVELNKSIAISAIDKLEILIFKNEKMNKSVVACDEIFLF